MAGVRPVRFMGNSLTCIREFPEDVRRDAAYQLEKVQRGERPADFKPIEIRVRDQKGQYRVIYLARRAEAVFVLHAFQKKAQKTRQADVSIARERYAALAGGGTNEKGR